jgi:uncharacterized lipoprotein YmbA
MKTIILAAGTALLLVGCASSNKDQLYYDAAKSISKDHTVAQTACWNAISEIAKGGDNGAKISAISLAEKCKAQGVKLEAPKSGWLGL